MTNLSQQLCGICGIEPKEKCKHFTGKEKCLLDIPHNACYCECFEQDYVYPDFEKPENFIKLEEIMLKELAKERLTVVKWVHEFGNELMHEYILITKLGHRFVFKHKGQKIDNWFVERESRTECLILFILWKVIPICGEQIKQAIKSEEWIYG